MSFYQPDSGAMSPSANAHAMPGSAEAKPVGSVEGLTMSQEPGEQASNYVPLSTLIQQFSRNPTQFQRHFWRHQMDLVENGFDSDGKSIDFYNLGSTPSGSSSALPLARIKKVMKNDDEVKMISAEAPILFSRACEIFISDLTCRAFMVAEENKRRTIQRSDIANAIARSDLFDFLIDIVPRSDMVRNRSSSIPIRNALSATNVAPVLSGDVGARNGMNEPLLEPKGSGFMPLRPSQPDMRGRMEGDMGLHSATQAMKGVPKAPLGNEWASPMYPFHGPNPMGDARVHPSAGMAIRGAPQSAPGLPRNGVDASPFMDAGSSLSMPPPQQRGAFLNMVSYPIDENKNESAPGE